jgi:UDP-GlcNAc3NAcA epimerase
MIKILSIIGTRPQYIKIKPLFDHFNKSDQYQHLIIDTLQHYSDNVSKHIIKDLGLSIDYSLEIDKSSELDFIANSIQKIGELILKENPDYVFVFGDTNSTFCAALSSYKMKKKICHIEAGLRCGNKTVPEEINRIFTDSVSDINFCSSIDAMTNVRNGIYCGDLEYELLNKLNPKIDFLDYGVMTIHRQTNCSINKLDKIMQYCRKTNKKIIFPAHHRIKKFLNKLEIPRNVEIIDPVTYTEMVRLMSGCEFIFTDSGSIQKTSAFFGKKTLIFREKTEWIETEEQNYCKKAENPTDDISWIFTRVNKRNKFLYIDSDSMPSEIITRELIK